MPFSLMQAGMSVICRSIGQETQYLFSVIFNNYVLHYIFIYMLVGQFGYEIAGIWYATLMSLICNCGSGVLIILYTDWNSKIFEIIKSVR